MQSSFGYKESARSIPFRLGKVPRNGSVIDRHIDSSAKNFASRLRRHPTLVFTMVGGSLAPNEQWQVNAHNFLLNESIDENCSPEGVWLPTHFLIE